MVKNYDWSKSLALTLKGALKGQISWNKFDKGTTMYPGNGLMVPKEEEEEEEEKEEEEEEQEEYLTK